MALDLGDVRPAAGVVAPRLLKIDAGRDLATGEILFSEGDDKDCVYRIEKGAVCLFRRGRAGGQQPIGFAFAGDLVGIGTLDRHMWSAQASVATRVSRLPREAADAIASIIPEVRDRVADASAREFDLLREQLTAQPRETPVRLAALLLVIADTNASEGRSGELIEDDMACGLVADMLRLEVDELADVLVDLGRRGLVRAEAGALRIVDRPGLERLAEG